MDARPTLIICGSDKGGVGKTTIARLAIDYLNEKGVQPSIFDTEPGAGVLRRFCPKAKGVDVAAVRGQMAIFDEVPNAGFTFVDLRAGVLSSVLAKMHDAGLLGEVREKKMRMIVLHVLGSNEASLREIADTSRVLAEGGEHVLVKNHATDGQFSDWDSYIVPEQKVLSIPHLDGAAADEVDRSGEMFSVFMSGDGADPKRPRSRYLKGMVRKWRADCFTELAKAKLYE